MTNLFGFDTEPRQRRRAPHPDLPRTITFTEAGIELDGSQVLFHIAQSSWLSREACVEIMYKGANICGETLMDVTSQHILTDDTDERACIERVRCARDVCAVFACVDSAGYRAYRVILRREIQD